MRKWGCKWKLNSKTSLSVQKVEDFNSKSSVIHCQETNGRACLNHTHSWPMFISLHFFFFFFFFNHNYFLYLSDFLSLYYLLLLLLFALLMYLLCQLQLQIRVVVFSSLDKKNLFLLFNIGLLAYLYPRLPFFSIWVSLLFIIQFECQVSFCFQSQQQREARLVGSFYFLF